MRQPRAWTPLLLAARRNNPDIVRALLEEGADPQLTVEGVSALNFAQLFTGTDRDKGIAEIIRAALQLHRIQ
jgi:ankyrin repeat protein